MCNKCGCQNPWRGAGPDLRKPKFSQEELSIIESAVNNALCFGTGILTACKELLEDSGYEWTEAHERFIFDHYVDK